MSKPAAMPMTLRRSRRPIFGIVGLTLLLIGAAGLMLAPRPPKPSEEATPAGADLPKDFGSLPDFSLIERSGKTITQADLLGKVTVVSFIFTRCHQTCPMVTGVMARLRAELPPETLLVSLSVDPRYDRPDVLKEYARNFKADSANWWFLTGQQEKVYDLIRAGFRVGVEENPDPATLPGELITHTTRLVVLDREGRLRGYFDSADPSAVSLLERKVKSLLAEQ